jgi:3-oxoacyl-[acyl-carrier-protein] synthase II
MKKGRTDRASPRRVVITGIGIISPVGNDVETYWENLLEGRSGIGRVTKFDVSPYPTKVAAEVNGFEPLDYLERREIRRLDSHQQYVLAATEQAIRDSRMEVSKLDPWRAGVIVGTGIGGSTSFEEVVIVNFTQGPDKVSPFWLPKTIPDLAAGYISMRFGFKGINFVTSSACASSSHAMGESFWAIKRGEADVMLTGGAENVICPVGWANFCASRAMSTHFNDDPPKSSRPFDKKRDGFVMGEGSAILVFEELKHALARDAKIYAEVLGVGNSADAYHITAPSPNGEGAAKAMELALKSAGVRPEQVDYINSHGTATVLGDVAETQAIKAVFGEHASRLPINSTKSIIGHPLGAAGAMEMVATVKSIETGWLHPTLNQEFPDPECDLDYVPNLKRQQKVDIALSNSFGFGGHNVSLAVSRYPEGPAVI